MEVIAILLAIIIIAVAALFILKQSKKQAELKMKEEIFNLLNSEGNLEKIEKLLADDLQVVKVKDKDGMEPLHYAARNGYLDIAVLLINRGADLNAREGFKEKGKSPLHFAAANGFREMVELIINRGAEVNLRDISGRTPLYWARLNKHDKIIELLRQHGGVE